MNDRTRYSLRTTISLVVVVGLVIPMVFIVSLAVYSEFNREKDLYHKDLERISNILALGAQKALWNMAPDELDPLMESIAGDERVAHIRFYDAENALFTELKNHRDPPENKEVIELESDIMNDGDKIGRVYASLYLSPLYDRLMQNMVTNLMATVAQVLVCLFLITIMLNKAVISKLNRLKDEASRLANKMLDHEFVWTEKNEIGSLGRSLEVTRSSLKELFQNLENIVEQRTETINTILNHVKSGFFILDRKLVVSEGFTKSCHDLLCDMGKGKKVTDVLGMEEREAEHYRTCLYQVFDDIFPEKVSLGQLPERIRIGDRTLSVEGGVIRDKNKEISNVLMTVNDVTHLEKIEKQNLINLSIIKILGQLDHFAGFVNDTRNQIDLARDQVDDQGTLNRILHTIKGNASVYGLDELVSLIHEIEDYPTKSREDLDLIESSFKEFLVQNYDILKIAYDSNMNSEKYFSVTSSHLEELSGDILGDIDANQKEKVLRWMWEIKKRPAAEVFSHLEDLVKRLSIKLYKKCRFKLEGGDLLIDPERFAPFVQVLPHLLRNSLDHGIESVDERGAKDERATITISIQDKDFYFWRVEVSDDGRGINTEALVKKALENGDVGGEQLANMSEQEKCMLVFIENISTAEAVTDISGRGIGMSAVKMMIEGEGGEVDIENRPGEGVTFIFNLAKKTFSKKIA